MLLRESHKSTANELAHTRITIEGTVTDSTIWISYDLGIRGDYEGLYAWLDAHKAKECGDSVAVLSYPHSASLPDDLKKDLAKSVTTDKRSRIYVIFRERTSSKNKGRFIFGGRRAAAWTGYAPSTEDSADFED